MVHHGLDLRMTFLRGVCSARVAEILLRLVSNKTPHEGEVGREGGGAISNDFRASSTWGQSIRAQLGLRDGARNSGASKRTRLGI